jgi:hypothetical protein
MRTACRDGYGGTGIRLMYAGFLGPQVWTACEAQEPGLGPFQTGHTYGIATTPAVNGEPRGRQECVIVVYDGDRDLFECLVAHEILVDTGRKAVMGYHEDCRVCRIPFEFEMFGQPAQSTLDTSALDQIAKKHGVEVHRLRM